MSDVFNSEILNPVPSDIKGNLCLFYLYSSVEKVKEQLTSDIYWQYTFTCKGTKNNYIYARCHPTLLFFSSITTVWQTCCKELILWNVLLMLLMLTVFIFNTKWKSYSVTVQTADILRQERHHYVVHHPRQNVKVYYADFDLHHSSFKIPRPLWEITPVIIFLSTISLNAALMLTVRGGK